MTGRVPSYQTVAPASNITGHISARYTFRSADTAGGTASDNDLQEQLRIDLTPAHERGYEIHFLGLARQDLDGDRDLHAFFPFEDICDTYDTWWCGYVYDAHIAFNQPAASVSQLRIGRQTGTRDVPVFFDGIAADLSFGQKLRMTAYGGVAVHFYELDDDYGSDYLGGAGIDYSLFGPTTLSVDYLYAHDTRDTPGATDQDDGLLSFRIQQRFGRSLRTAVKYRTLKGDPRDLEARAVQAFADAGLELSATYFRQFRVQEEQANELAPYYDVLGPYFPFQSVDLKLRKFFGRTVAVDVGYFTRDLVEDWRESTFDRKYDRAFPLRKYDHAFAMVSLYDVLAERLSLSLTGETYDTGTVEYGAWGFDAGYRFGTDRRSASLSLGTYYSLYKYDSYVVLGQRENVQTYYARGRIPLAKKLMMDLEYAYEDGIETYHTARAGVRYDF